MVAARTGSLARAVTGRADLSGFFVGCAGSGFIAQILERFAQPIVETPQHVAEQTCRDFARVGRGDIGDGRLEDFAGFLRIVAFEPELTERHADFPKPEQVTEVAGESLHEARLSTNGFLVKSADLVDGGW
jgi:hypothetical protein